MPTMEINKIIEGFNLLNMDEKEYVADIISKQLIDYRREQIAKRANDARKNLQSGHVKNGNVQDLLEDLEND